MNRLFEKTGVMAIGTRLRMLSERLAKDADKIYDLYNVDIKSKWYPVVFELLNDESKTVTQIANEIGHTHVSVVKIVKEMSKANMLIETKDENDGRKTNISLSDYGKEVVKGLEHQHQDVTQAMQKMLGGMSHNLWLALDEFEDLLDEKSTYPRVVEEQRKRESNHIKIIEFEDKYTEDFKALNKWWIDEYFKMEQKDEYILSNPRETIINNGGTILIALYDDIPVGACALLKLENQAQDYELSKMGIAKEYNGRGIGKILCQAIIDKAKDMGANSLHIETNSVLIPAISLYKKLGFKQIFNHSSTYGRSDYHLELVLDKNSKK